MQAGHQTQTTFLLFLGWALACCIDGPVQGSPPAAPKVVQGNGVLETPEAKVQLVADGFQFTEGPAVDAEGNLFFTDQPNNRIMKLDIDGKLSEFLKPAGRSNGLFFSKAGTLIACADENNQMWKIQMDGSHRVLFEGFEGAKLNGPNDLWIDDRGRIYFTDPYYQRPWWQHQKQPQAKQAVYRVDGDGESITVMDDTLQQPNGIVGDSKKRLLFVADIRDSKTYRYKIANDGSLVDRVLFCRSGSDGMTLDDQGNLYLTGSKGVTVFNQAGEQIELISVPESWTANVCIGGRDRKTLFITASDSLYSIRLQNSGLQH